MTLRCPGMVVGSPEMEQGGKYDLYKVLLVKKDGTTVVLKPLSCGYNYSALSSWQRNVADRVAKIRGLIPMAPNGGAGCGV
jgi:hypothetical protein